MMIANPFHVQTNTFRVEQLFTPDQLLDGVRAKLNAMTRHMKNNSLIYDVFEGR
jgi:hypothetical protein